MNRKVLKTSVAAAMTVGLFGLQAPAPADAAEGDFELTIMHTNDTHANLDNVAKRAALVKKVRAENPNNLLLDAGDVFSGTLYFNTFQGQADLEFMNYMKYDAMTFGNHEFDLGDGESGHAALAEFVGGADFPFVSANVDFSKEELLSGFENDVYSAEAENGQIYNGIIKEIDGEQVGIFGLTTAETVTISSPGDVAFTDYIEAAEEAVAAFEAAGVNKVVALTHLGYDDSSVIDNDLLLAEAVEGIDVIVGGHSHTKLAEPVLYDENEEPVIIVQAEQYNNFLGQLDVTFDENGAITSHTGLLHDVKAEGLVADAEAAALLAPYAEEIKELKETSIGVETTVALDGSRGLWGVRAGETNLGNLITDGMLAAAKKIDAKTVIAVQNGGGIRAGIGKGDITMGEVLTVMPFGNALAIMNLTGAELKTALEHSVRMFPAENGGFLHVSGLQFTFDPSKAAGSRVTDVQVKTGAAFEKLNDTKNYKVATNTFTAKGGDGFDSFGAAYKDGRVSEPGNIDYEMFIEHAKSLGTVSPKIEYRIKPYMPLADIATNNWYYGYVQDLYFQKIIRGTTETTFSPNRQLSRAQAASIFVRALDLETEEVEESPFTDISRVAKETQSEIDAAHKAGLVIGMDNKFMPNENITRSQFALMLNRAYDYMEDEDYVMDELAPFKDIAQFDAETHKAITMVYDFDIADGIDNNFMPANPTTRAHAAKMISNFLTKIK